MLPTSVQLVMIFLSLCILLIFPKLKFNPLVEFFSKYLFQEMYVV